MIRISQLVVLGDSLSDRGTLYKRMLLGILPMSYLSGLSKKASSKDRFTNGYLWGDYVSATAAENFEINCQRRRLKLNHDASNNADIGDEFLSNTVLREQSHSAFSLNDDKHVLFKGSRFARFYCEGGLTAHDYSSYFTLDPTVGAFRLILSTLEKKREELLADDKKYQISKREKAETLVIEWSGANDLMTVNEAPSYQAADNAINERIKNIELLIQNGYRNFVLFNLPNFSLTPRYQAKDKKEQDNASKCSEYFNEQLAKRCTEINKKYKDLSIPITLSVFDVNAQLKKAYDNPERYGFDKDKLKKTYTQSEEFERNKQNPDFIAEKTSPAPGYMFWDDVHPTMTMHNWLAVQFKKKYSTLYDFVATQLPHKKSTKDDFDIQKASRLSEDNSKLVRTVNLPKDVKAILKTIDEKAKSMCQSSYPNYQEKGLLLKKFLFELKCQNGDLEKMHEVIATFNRITNNMGVIKTHYYPIYDFFAWKTTTHSEDLMTTLADTIKAHLSTLSPLLF